MEFFGPEGRFSLDSHGFLGRGHRDSIFLKYPQECPHGPVAPSVSPWTPPGAKTVCFHGLSRDFQGFEDVTGRRRKSMELGRLGLEPRTKALKGPCSTN
jgi:hypothetical protein